MKKALTKKQKVIREYINYIENKSLRDDVRHTASALSMYTDEVYDILDEYATKGIIKNIVRYFKGEGMKVLNLYAGIGGNRKLWKGVDVTAVEINPEVATIYQDLFPQDRVIIGDAHQYLLEHFKEFDFIWSSPACQTHSKFRKNIACSVREGNPTGRWAKPVYPDLKLYEEIIFLQHYFKGKYCVENVVAYYEPLIKPQRIQRHWFWTNYPIIEKSFDRDNIARGSQKEHERRLGIDLSKYKVSSRKNGQSRSEVLEKDQILRNCVDPELGYYVFNMANAIVCETLDRNYSP